MLTRIHPGFSFDGSYISAGSEDGKSLVSHVFIVNNLTCLWLLGRGIRIWHVETGEEVHMVNTGYTSTVVAWAPLHYAIAFNDSGYLNIASVLERR